MTKRALLAILVGLSCLCSYSRKSTASHSSQSSRSAVTSAATDEQKSSLTVCSGTYALCTAAKCTLTAGSDSSIPTVSCLCDVKQGYSAGTKPCSEVPKGPPQPGQSIPSRYFPIKSMAVCANKRPWAFCLERTCTVDADPSKANCTCNLIVSPMQSYVVVTDSYNASTCTSDIVSSVTVHDVIQLTGFLQDSVNLKSFPITIVGVGPGDLQSRGYVVSEGYGMLPAIQESQRVVIDSVDGDAGFEIKRGDIVLFWFPDDPSRSYIKRIIGLPGDTVEINQGTIIINGRKLDEPYVDSRFNRSRRSQPPIYVRANYYYVLGDNRDNSSDSRIWGLVPKKYIYAKVVVP